MRRGGTLLAVIATFVLAVILPAAAQAAKHCEEPGAYWQRATPVQAGMNAAKLDAAVAFAQRSHSSAVRVYRYGCLVAEDSLNPESRSQPTQSFSVAKSIVSLAFGRAMTLGLIGPDDPLGALLPKADRAHGALTMRDLLTMTEGLSLDKSHDFNVGIPDRVRDLLTLPFVARPGSTFAYFQSGPPTVTAALGAAAGEDFQAFIQRQLFTPIGIPARNWYWGRDAVGTTDGFWDLNMRADDYARFGELLRRGGVWNGRRLLSTQYVTAALEPIRAFGCYGWFIWRLATSRCNDAAFLGLPQDMWQFNGSGGQLVTVFPTQGLMIVRTGTDPTGVNWAPSAGGVCGCQERRFYDGVLASLTNRRVADRHPPADPRIPTALQQQRAPDSTAPTASAQPPLPPDGPWRARAATLSATAVRVDAAGHVTLTFALHCPPRWPGGHRRCSGTLTGHEVRARAAFNLAAGATGAVRLQLSTHGVRLLDARRSLTIAITATDRDGTSSGTPAVSSLTLLAPHT